MAYVEVSKSSKISNRYNQIPHLTQDTKRKGVTISDDLKWSSHICKITKKANSILGFFKRNLKHCPLNCRMTAYISLVRSTLEYSSVIWDPYLQILTIRKSSAPGCQINLRKLHLKGSWLRYTDAFRPTSSPTPRQKES